MLSTYHVANGNPGTAVYRYYIVQNLSDVKLDSVDVRFVSTVGVKEPGKPIFSVFPNPATDHVNVTITNGATDTYRLVFYSLVGEEVLVKEISGGTR